MSFPVLCAWCLAEGKHKVVGRSTVEGSHGVCVEHLDELVGGLSEEKRQEFRRKEREAERASILGNF